MIKTSSWVMYKAKGWWVCYKRGKGTMIRHPKRNFIIKFVRLSARVKR